MNNIEFINKITTNDLLNLIHSKFDCLLGINTIDLKESLIDNISINNNENYLIAEIFIDDDNELDILYNKIKNIKKINKFDKIFDINISKTNKRIIMKVGDIIEPFNI